MEEKVEKVCVGSMEWDRSSSADKAKIQILLKDLEELRKELEVIMQEISKDKNRTVVVECEG